METAYFTFGQNHVHRFNEIILGRDYVLRITDNDPRGRMFSLFGDKWSFQYNASEIDLRYFKRGILPIDKDNSFVRWETNWNLQEFRTPDLFASFIIDRVLDLGTDVSKDFVECFPDFNDYMGIDLHVALEHMEADSPNYLKYGTIRGWLYDVYNEDVNTIIKQAELYL